MRHAALQHVLMVSLELHGGNAQQAGKAQLGTASTAASMAAAHHAPASGTAGRGRPAELRVVLHGRQQSASASAAS
eukprot:CAMPEP_0202879950 /NCGR_PEP_ID=MMETSP1391-20130828/34359_1 /ASSEMBLY_ACC=CAM_ASM_000867 /TAXON_ID=1034604 /ORGANISM="Chlamydomonas leiostraca, Strain SAG 11-49" /LENGTH=75 /DNA_ID=CAMNT_0049562373 /DNA_START=72 /DNA_END=296 /DNA_ORIENTATION=+